MFLMNYYNSKSTQWSYLLTMASGLEIYDRDDIAAIEHKKNAKKEKYDLALANLLANNIQVHIRTSYDKLYDIAESDGITTKLFRDTPHFVSGLKQLVGQHCESWDLEFRMKTSKDKVVKASYYPRSYSIQILNHPGWNFDTYIDLATVIGQITDMSVTIPAKNLPVKKCDTKFVFLSAGKYNDDLSVLKKEYDRDIRFFDGDDKTRDATLEFIENKSNIEIRLISDTMSLNELIKLSNALKKYSGFVVETIRV
jgi:hypothetical protein